MPQFQGQGIGTGIVNRLLKYIKENTTPGTFVSVGLTAASGKDTFYEKFGFSKSLGMTKYIEILIIVSRQIVTKSGISIFRED